VRTTEGKWGWLERWAWPRGVARAVGVAEGRAAQLSGSPAGPWWHLETMASEVWRALWPYSHRADAESMSAEVSGLPIPRLVVAGCGGSLSGFLSECGGTPGTGGCPTGLREEGGQEGNRCMAVG
jgi:hypothetical protein